MKNYNYQVMQTLFPAKARLESKVIKALKKREAPSLLLMQCMGLYMGLQAGTALLHTKWFLLQHIMSLRFVLCRTPGATGDTLAVVYCCYALIYILVVWTLFRIRE